ncbi:hypothetical protein R1sor_013328 [Riccia sorocarpa]|uniref:RING-type domain-containing protein n=1 Tax=Riccia sorocarpa TaxID=122646 RepID=A0ABD3HCC6_9MARC
MSEGAWMDSGTVEIGWLDLEDLTDTGMQKSSMDPVRSTEPASGSQPATLEPKKKKKKKKKKAIPDVQAAVPEGVDVPSSDEVSLIPPNGIPGEVCLGIQVNVEEFKNDFTSGHRLHGVKVDWTTVDLSQAINTVSYDRRMAARRELFRMRVRMDGRLVETMDPDEMEKSQKSNRSRKRKRRLASETKDGVATEATGGSIVAIESVVERSQKGKEKVFEASAEPDSMEDKMMKRALKISRADQYKQPTIATPTGETSGRGSNQPLTSDVPVDDRTGSNTMPSIRVLEESASNLATNTMSHMTLVMEERKRVQRLQASMEECLAKIQKENLALKNKVHTLEDEKQQMSDRVALMGKPDLYELLGAKMEGFQLQSHAGTVVDFQNLVLTTIQKWTGIPSLNLERFRQCPDEYPDFAAYAKGWDGWNNHCSLCKSSLGFLPSVNTGVCLHNFHFACFGKYASTKRLCPECRKALPDATYDFFCRIFAPRGDDSNHVPEVLVQREVSVEPECPIQPEVPIQPDVPIQPEVPVEPDLPIQPEVPVEPDLPIQPEVPVQPEVLGGPFAEVHGIAGESILVVEGYVAQDLDEDTTGCSGEITPPPEEITPQPEEITPPHTRPPEETRPTLLPYAGSVYNHDEWLVLVAAHQTGFMTYLLDVDSWRGASMPREEYRYIDGDPARSSNLAGYINSVVGTRIPHMDPNVEWVLIEDPPAEYGRRDLEFHIATVPTRPIRAGDELLCHYPWGSKSLGTPCVFPRKQK